jgi:hypothetical protein
MRYNKLVIFFILSFQTIFADTTLFDTNCKNCHFSHRQLNIFISRYTLQYSNENDIKKAIFKYLKNPKKENSVMPIGFLNRFGVKKPIQLNDKLLKKSIDQYYQIYNLQKRIH